MLVGEGTTGETLAEPDDEQGPVSMDYVSEIGVQVATRFPSLGPQDWRPRGPGYTT